MVHLPYGGDIEIDIKKGGVEGQWRAWWISPRDGGREVFERGEGVGGKTFNAPSGGSLDEDWLLLVEEDVWPPLKGE
jgi:hypothetical protein